MKSFISLACSINMSSHPEFCFHDDPWSWWLLYFSREVFQKLFHRELLFMLLSWCLLMYIASYHTILQPIRNHLKRKMISIIIEISRFLFLRFLSIRFFPFISDMGFFLFPLVLSRFRTIPFIMTKFITSKSSYFVHISFISVSSEFIGDRFLNLLSQPLVGSFSIPS